MISYLGIYLNSYIERIFAIQYKLIYLSFLYLLLKYKVLFINNLCVLNCGKNFMLINNLKILIPLYPNLVKIIFKNNLLKYT